MNMKEKWWKQSRVHNLLFLAVFAGLAWLFGYPETFFNPPQSVHTWRQTNGLSMTQMYYQYDVPFFEPEIHNQFSEDGLSGKTAGEFPIIYYFMAQVWKVTGKSEWSFRLFHLLILYAGLFLLFLTVKRATGNLVAGGFTSLLVYTSPMVIFYGPNFLPDVPSLALVFMAWYFLYQFTLGRKYHFLWFSAISFTLAISLKITASLSFIAIGAWAVAELFLVKKKFRVLNFRLSHFLPFVLGLVLASAWYLYVERYTSRFGGSFSHHGIWPAWNMTSEQFHRIIDSLDKIYFREFFWPPLQYATLAVWLFMLFNIRKIHPFLGYMLLIMPLGLMGILILWFQVLEGHDYYMITQIQVLVIVWAAFFYHLKDRRFMNHPVALVVMVLLLAILAGNGRHRHMARYEGWMNEGYTMHMEALTEIEPMFRQWGIHPDDKVISIPDFSVNASLYYMGRRGYTDFASDFSREEIFRKRIEQGARYLVINDTTMLANPVAGSFAQHFLGEYRNVRVYDLQPFLENR